VNAITSEKNKLGFVGVGYMGRPIARRLLEAGFNLTAYDRDRGKAEELSQYGGKVADSVASLSSSRLGPRRAMICKSEFRDFGSVGFHCVPAHPGPHYDCRRYAEADD
jgi:nucleoside-diphosphate-sugar epimerase